MMFYGSQPLAREAGRGQGFGARMGFAALVNAVEKSALKRLLQAAGKIGRALVVADDGFAPPLVIIHVVAI
jgi:hypothetical protein